MPKHPRSLRRIRRRGVAYVLMALLTTPLLGAVGFAVDLGAAQLVNVRLQAARHVTETSSDFLLSRSGRPCDELRARAENRADRLRRITIGGVGAFGARIAPATATCDSPSDMDIAINAKYRRSFISLVTGQEAGVRDAVANTPRAFVSVWETANAGASADNRIVLPLTTDGEDRLRIDWGDGTTSRVDDVTSPGDVAHTYAAPGRYEVTIRGQIDGLGFNGVSNDPGKLVEIKSWGAATIADGGNQFRDTANLTITAGDRPNTSAVRDARNMFRNSGIATGVADWDTGHVRTMRHMFRNTPNFDADIGGWDVANVYDMTGMFEDASDFNHDLSGWCVERIESRPDRFDTGATDWSTGRPPWDASCL